MSKHTHTPGPWHTVQVGDHARHLAVADSNGISLLTVVDEDETPFGAVYEEADARLIAAAPQLLEAVSQMLFRFGDDGAESQYARAAIAMATGQAGEVR